MTASRLYSAVLLGFLAALMAASPAEAQQITLDLGEGGALSERVIQLIALITVLSLAPSILVMVTSFARIVIVLSLLRSAIGTQQSPPNAVLISLALFLTAFIMAPTFETAYKDGIAPLMAGDISQSEAFDKTIAPFRSFMLGQVREKDLQLFVDLSKTPVQKAEAIPLQVLVPAFMISELRRAFEIGFLIFIPFVVIDLVVSSILMSMGMMMLPPIMIALPFKLIFFVLVDGWYLITGSLVQSFGGG
jgi:flagellar biosynthetic protein FliP